MLKRVEWRWRASKMWWDYLWSMRPAAQKVMAKAENQEQGTWRPGGVDGSSRVYLPNYCTRVPFQLELQFVRLLSMELRGARTTFGQSSLQLPSPSWKRDGAVPQLFLLEGSFSSRSSTAAARASECNDIKLPKALCLWRSRGGKPHPMMIGGMSGGENI